MVVILDWTRGDHGNAAHESQASQVSAVLQVFRRCMRARRIGRLFVCLFARDASVRVSSVQISSAGIARRARDWKKEGRDRREREESDSRVRWAVRATHCRPARLAAAYRDSPPAYRPSLAASSGSRASSFARSFVR